MRVSIREVARHAGVSPKTVSNVLLERAGRVSPETRRRVFESVRELNYVPVRAAVQNRHIETHVIGLVFDQGWESSDAGVRVLEGVRNGALQHGYDFLVMLRTRAPWLHDRAEARFLDRRCDGFIFITPGGQKALLETLLQHGISITACFTSDVPIGVSWVMADNQGAMRCAIEYLVARGHRRIAHFGGPENSYSARKRCEAFEQLLAEFDLPVYEGQIQTAGWGPGDSQAHLTAADLLRYRPTAVVCANDDLALKLWDVARAQQLRVPQDISIIGMDNTLEGAERGLTSLINPLPAIGYEAVNSLIAVMRGGAPEKGCKVIPVDLAERTSVLAIDNEARQPS